MAAAIDRAMRDAARMDDFARSDAPMQRLDPRAKVAVALVYVITVVSFDRREVGALVPFLAFPVALAALGGVPLGYLMRKALIAAPFAVMVGIANPFLDREPALAIGGLVVSGGWLSFASILLRSALTVLGVLALVAVTGLDALCAGLQRLGVPQAFTMQLLILYRYLFVLGEEGARVARARALRSAGKRGLGWRAYASLLGSLLLRTLDRAERIHVAMACRGFAGEVRLRRRLHLRPADALFAIGWCGAFAAMRFVDLPELIGSALTGVFR